MACHPRRPWETAEVSDLIITLKSDGKPLRGPSGFWTKLGDEWIQLTRDEALRLMGAGAVQELEQRAGLEPPS